MEIIECAKGIEFFQIIERLEDWYNLPNIIDAFKRENMLYVKLEDEIIGYGTYNENSIEMVEIFKYKKCGYGRKLVKEIENKIIESNKWRKNRESIEFLEKKSTKHRYKTSFTIKFDVNSKPFWERCGYTIVEKDNTLKAFKEVHFKDVYVVNESTD